MDSGGDFQHGDTLFVDDEPDVEIALEGVFYDRRMISRRELEIISEAVWVRGKVARSNVCPLCRRHFVTLHGPSPFPVPACPYCSYRALSFDEYGSTVLDYPLIRGLLHRLPRGAPPPEGRARPIWESASRVLGGLLR